MRREEAERRSVERTDVPLKWGGPPAWGAASRARKRRGPGLGKEARTLTHLHPRRVGPSPHGRTHCPAPPPFGPPGGARLAYTGRPRQTPPGLPGHSPKAGFSDIEAEGTKAGCGRGRGTTLGKSV